MKPRGTKRRAGAARVPGPAPRGPEPAAPPVRKGAVRMSEIPKQVLEGLNEGRLETITLVEWLAVDIRRLARAAAPQVGLDGAAAEVAAAADRLAAEGVTTRSRGMGAALHGILAPRRDRGKILSAISSHPSDMVRAWGAYVVAADPDLDLAARLEALRPFAADRSLAVRECAWEAFRPWLAADLERGLRLLRPWVRDEDPNVRRCAVEGTRPRGVWTRHLEPMKEDPGMGLPLLEPVRSDPSDYVRRAVANWLNDASKSRPAWVRSVCARWRRESPTRETAWIVARGLRTLEKKKASRAL